MSGLHIGLELLLAAAAVGAGIVVTVVLFRWDDLDRPGAGTRPDFQHALAVNALGVLLLGTFVASSALLADALCRMVQLAD